MSYYNSYNNMLFFLQANKTALPIINLIEVMKPGVIDFSIVKQGEKLNGEVGATIIFIPV